MPERRPARNPSDGKTEAWLFLTLRVEEDRTWSGAGVSAGMPGEKPVLLGDPGQVLSLSGFGASISGVRRLALLVYMVCLGPRACF